MTPKTNKTVTTNETGNGKDYLYVCQNPCCQNVEKEFALHSRNYKYCSNCGWIAVKSQLISTFNWIASY